MNRPDTAAKEATAVSGETFSARAIGISAFAAAAWRVQQSRSKEEDDGQQPRMTLNHFTSGIFDPVDVVGNESIRSATQTPRIQIQALIPALKVLELRMLSVSTLLDNGGQSCNAEHDDQDCVGVVFISGFSTRPMLGLLMIA